MNRREAGSQAEDLAEQYLVSLGYSIIKRNFTFGKIGEIDIICMDIDTLVFVEVKARTTMEYGTPESSITPKKTKALRRTAEGFLYIRKIHNVECRFDVIAIDFSIHPYDLRHLINAF